MDFDKETGVLSERIANFELSYEDAWGLWFDKYGENSGSKRMFKEKLRNEVRVLPRLIGKSCRFSYSQVVSAPGIIVAAYWRGPEARLEVRTASGSKINLYRKQVIVEGSDIHQP